MIRRFSKVVAIMLCFCMVFSQTAYLASRVNDYQPEESRTTQVSDPPKSLLDRIKVSTIPKENIYIPAGTTLDVTLKNQISSKTSKVGETVDFETTENLIINNVVVIPKGTIGQAVITEARSAGGLGRAGKLSLQPVSIYTKNGVEVPLTSALKGNGDSDGGAVVVFAAVSILGGIFMKGTNVTYPAGTHFKVTVKNDTDLGVTNETLAETMDKNEPQGKKITIIRE